jgi:hypothetical protein
MDEELGASTLVPDGSFHTRETTFARQYREENEGSPNTLSASEELRVSSVEGRKNLYHRNAVSHLATHFWPSELYMPARLGSGARTDWSPYPTFGRFSLYFPEFLINQVTIWESGHVRRDAAGAVLSWLNTYADRLQQLDLQDRTADAQTELGRLLGV